MIGIQGETALDEVTKSPADAELSTTSTNSVQNKVITKKINEINNDLTWKVSANTAITWTQDSQDASTYRATINVSSLVSLDDIKLGLSLKVFEPTVPAIGSKLDFYTVHDSMSGNRAESGNSYYLTGYIDGNMNIYLTVKFFGSWAINLLSSYKLYYH